VTDFAFIYNSIEIVLWAAIGVCFLIVACNRSGPSRLRCLIAAIAFLLFAASDAVELYTGAWWKPWWLFVWKMLCGVTLLLLYIDNLVSRRGRRQAP